MEEIILKNIKIYSYLTCIYLPIMVFVLTYFNILYNIGKYKSYPLMLVLIFAEVLKHTLSEPYIDKNKAIKKKKGVKLSKIVRCVFIVVLMIAFHYVIAVLFGAQLFQALEETFMFSVILTTLTIIPACIHLGIDKIVYILKNVAPYEGDLMSEFVFQNICLVYIGTWFGAFVIPLDWDRPWQLWPVPCSLGAIIGYFISHLSVMCGIQRNFRLSKRKTGKYDL